MIKSIFAAKSSVFSTHLPQKISISLQSIREGGTLRFKLFNSKSILINIFAVFIKTFQANRNAKNKKRFPCLARHYSHLDEKSIGDQGKKKTFEKFYLLAGFLYRFSTFSTSGKKGGEHWFMGNAFLQIAAKREE